MDSMLDLEQLRMSVNEQDIPSAINQVHQWIDTHGFALLRANQRLPFDYAEAEEIRKQHEKVELKCMTFLAYYAKINLKDIPEQYEEMREDMDITIHKFSEHIKARRHLVVSSYTFFRHLRELQDKLFDFQNVDLSDLPDSMEEINILIGKFHKNTNNCLKRLSHLKEEADRVKSSMDTVVGLSNNPGFVYIDLVVISACKQHIDRILKETEVEVTRMFESQRLLELELKIEAKMMVIEDDITRCCGWLQRMEQRLLERYNDKVVGMTTVENDVLCQEAEELTAKMRMTKDYGAKLLRMHDRLCDQFRRDKSRGQAGGDKLEELWALCELMSGECLGRLDMARTLFHGLDSTLDKIEDMLLSISKDKENSFSNEDIVDKYHTLRDGVVAEFEGLKELANELFKKLRFNLFNEKLGASNDGYLEAEQTEDMVKMKIFTIAVKLKELYRHIFVDDIPPGQKITRTMVEPVSSEPIDEDLRGNIEKFMKFLKTSQLNWESKPLPVSLDQAVKVLKEHQEVSNHSEQYWRDIQSALGSINSQSKSELIGYQQLLAGAAREKKNWDIKWREHLDEELNPRHVFLKKMHEFNSRIGENIDALDGVVARPNDTLTLVKEVNDDLNRMSLEIPKKEQTLDSLHKEANGIHRSDFMNQLAIVDDNLQCYRDRLNNFKELEAMIKEILEFLPKLSSFKRSWQERVNARPNSPSQLNQLKNEAGNMKANASRFDRGKLRKLATKTYGNTKRVEWIIEELKADFILPSANEEYITPKAHGRQEQSIPDGPIKEVAVNAILHSPTEMTFKVENLPKVDKDQYNIQWYKNNVMIDPNQDPRMQTSSEPRRGRANMYIEKCEYADAGQYWFEIHDGLPEVLISNPVTLTVFGAKPSMPGKVEPKFGERVYAGRNDALTLELKLDGFRFAPDSELKHNNKLIQVNQRDCPWIRVSSNTVIEFTNPSITDFDRGTYEFFISEKVEAKTQLIVGDAPKFLRHHFNEKVKLGDTISVTIPTADIANKADQKVAWKKGDKDLGTDFGKFRSRVNDDGDPCLDISQVAAADAGVYHCEVSNVYGKSSAKMVLEVSDKAAKRNIAEDGSTIEKLIVPAGESFILDITYVPAKNTKVEWTKDGSPINTADPRIKISNDGRSRCSLQLLDTQERDSGVYTASLKDTNRSQSTIIEITRPQIYAPVIVKCPHTIRVKPNDPINLDCQVRSNPRLSDVCWTLHPEDRGSPRTLASDNRTRLSTNVMGEEAAQMERVHLSIDRVSRADAGEYVVRCRNEVGSSSAKVTVAVVGAEEVQNKKKAPTFVQSLKREMTTLGDEPVLFKCKVAGNPLPTVKWSKDGMQVVPSDFVKMKNVGDVHELCVLNPRAADSGTYEVTASNNLGSDTSQCLLKVVPSQNIPVSEIAVPKFVISNERNPDDLSDIEQPSQRTQMIFSNTVVRSPPQFVTTFIDEVVEEGADVVLKCCLIGQPEPVVWWSYNTHLLKNPRFEMSREKDEYRLLMRNMRDEDSGRYSMTAENSSGLATCSALVIVNKKNSEGRRSLDRSQYKTNSRPMNTGSLPAPFQCHTTLSNSLNASLTDESRKMQVSPRGWQEPPRSKSSPNSPFINSR